MKSLCACLLLVTALALSEGKSLAASSHVSPSSAKAAGFQGIWLGTQGTPWTDPRYRSTDWSPNPAKMFTPWGAAESQRLRNGPDTPGDCEPYGPGTMMSGWSAFPTLIAQAGDLLLVTIEVTMVPRMIHMDRATHPKDVDPTWEGDSVSHWEGDTLVIDTVGVNGLARPLNGYLAPAVTPNPGDFTPRLPISDQMHMVERLRLVNPDYLEDQQTITDPKTYAGSFSRTTYWNRRPDLAYDEFFCSDRAQNDSAKH